MSKPKPTKPQQRMRHCHHFLAMRNSHSLTSESELAMLMSHFTDKHDKKFVVHAVMNLSRSSPHNILYVQTRYGILNPPKFIDAAIRKFNAFASCHGLQAMGIVAADSEFSLSRKQRDASRHGAMLRGCSGVEVKLEWKNEALRDQYDNEKREASDILDTKQAKRTRKRWTAHSDSMGTEITRLRDVVQSLQEENKRLRHESINAQRRLAMARPVV